MRIKEVLKDTLSDRDRMNLLPSRVQLLEPFILFFTFAFICMQLKARVILTVAWYFRSGAWL